MKHILCLVCLMALLAGLVTPAGAVEMDGGAQYCFGIEDFTPGETKLAGICITELPEASGSVMLGTRVVRAGDVLTAEQVEALTFDAGAAETDQTAVIRYLPVFANGLSGEASMTLSIRGRDNKEPIAEDSAFETYKNLDVRGQLRVRDPEEQAMTFTVVRQPRRGSVEIREDGSFTYTPKKNKVGIDSFTYTATDAAGKVSREATVTVSIIKPTDSRHYTDTAGKNCRFAAEWMKNSGIFVGESVAGSPCFSPDRPVTRGEFLSMLVKTLKLPTDERITETGYQNAPDWLKPYLAAAIRSGLTAGLEDGFPAEAPMDSDTAASMLCIALDAADSQELLDRGIPLGTGTLTRADAAEILYQTYRVTESSVR